MILIFDLSFIQTSKFNSVTGSNDSDTVKIVKKILAMCNYGSIPLMDQGE